MSSGQNSAIQEEDEESSRPSTLIGDKIVQEDPFDGRTTFGRLTHRSSTSIAESSLNSLAPRRRIDSDLEDSDSYMGSMISGNFGGTQAQIKTPGFTSRKFTFTADNDSLDAKEV